MSSKKKDDVTDESKEGSGAIKRCAWRGDTRTKYKTKFSNVRCAENIH